jgi:hypothetical protein
MPIINGKTVNNLPKFATEQDVINAVRETRPNRLVIMKTPQGFKSLDRYKQTQVPSDAIFKIVPRRVKAFFGYDGNNKSNLTKQIIFSQVSALEKKVFPQGIEIDANYNWFRIKQYRLPLEWRKYNKQEVVPLLIVIPDQFPSLPPNGFYLPRTVKSQSKLGDSLSFIEESEPGDLAFFDDEDGNINHVGIMLTDNYILHAYGKVRIDRLDHLGIFNEFLNKHTHQLRIIKQVVRAK